MRIFKPRSADHRSWKDLYFNLYVKPYSNNARWFLSMIFLLLAALCFGGGQLIRDNYLKSIASTPANTDLTFTFSKETLTTKQILVSKDRKTMVLPLSRGSNSNLTSAMNAYRTYTSYYGFKAPFTKKNAKMALATAGDTGDILVLIHTDTPQNLMLGTILENSRQYNQQDNQDFNGTDDGTIDDGGTTATDDIVLGGKATTGGADSDHMSAAEKVRQQEKEEKNKSRENANINAMNTLTKPNSDEDTALAKRQKNKKKSKTGQPLKDTDSIWIQMNAYSKGNRKVNHTLWKDNDFDYSQIGKQLYVYESTNIKKANIKTYQHNIEMNKQELKDLESVKAKGGSDDALDEKIANVKTSIKSNEDSLDKIHSDVDEFSKTDITKSNFIVNDSAHPKKDKTVGRNFTFINQDGQQ